MRHAYFNYYFWIDISNRVNDTVDSPSLFRPRRVIFAIINTYIHLIINTFMLLKFFLRGKMTFCVGK